MIPLFLVGFMAAGKTSVGRALAARSGRRFVDLDELVGAELDGETVAQLVARDEAELRRREAAALSAVIAGAHDGPIVATGGGAAVHGDNLTRMRDAGLTVALGVGVDDALARAAGGPARPLLANAAALAAARAPAYRRAAAVIDTTGRSVDEVVDRVAEIERAWARIPPRLRAGATLLELADRSYPITIADGFDADLIDTHLPAATKLAVITDRNVAAHWLAPLAAALAGRAIETIALEPGEASKSFAVYERVCTELIARGIDRSSAIIALGGGVVGDLAGFVAATLFRGIPVVQIPTTLVAMTDAAIGGKTAIDLPAGKNLVGAFWQPRLVACNAQTLSTLPARERRAGFGELWKYALLDGPALWTEVARCAADERAPMGEVIARAIAYKAAIVSADERERTGRRALLNLGHTVGHAIEAASLSSSAPLLHGEAVGLGLIAACQVSSVLGLCKSTLAADVAGVLERTGLPHELAPWLTDDVLARISVDKKRVGATLRLVAIREVGACEPVDLAVDQLRRILRSLPSA